MPSALGSNDTVTSDVSICILHYTMYLERAVVPSLLGITLTIMKECEAVSALLKAVLVSSESLLLSS